MDENFDFLKEEIKKQKPYVKWLKRAGEALFSGVIIAAVVLLVMLFVYPALKTDSQISLQNDNDKPEVSETGVSSAVSSSVVSAETSDSASVVEESSSVVPEIEEQDSEAAAPSAKENMMAMSEDIMEVANTVKKSMVTVIGITEDKDWFNETYENQGQLSGLIIAKKSNVYYILTEYRVVKDVNRIMVTFSDGTSADARFIRRDPATSLAVIRVDAQDISKEAKEYIQPVDIERYTAVSQGENVIALGSPMGYSDSVACGMVTSVDNTLNVTDNAYHVICTDIPASADGSGILLNLEGKVVGIMAQKLADTKEIGLMICLSTSEILTQVEDLCNDKPSVYLGVQGQQVTGNVSGGTGIPKGVYVNAVEKDSPAMVTGIQAGDVIFRVNTESVYTMKDIHTALKKEGTGKKVTIYAMRQGNEGYVEMKFDVEIAGK